MQNFRTYQLAKVLYLETRKLRLRGAVRDQLERAALSIATNLAEGSGKIGEKDRRRFYSMAFCSVREVQAITLILENQELGQQIDKIAASCHCLLRAVQPS